MRIRIVLALFIVALCAVASPRASADQAHAKVQLEAGTRGLAKAGSLRATRAHAVRLESPSADAVDREIGRPAKFAPLKVGFGRDVPAAAFEWEGLPGGAQVAAVRITSEAAASVRAALRVLDLPAGATVRFQGADGTELFEASGAEVNDTLARNAEAGDHGPDARLFWSPLFDGNTLSIEVELPPGVDPAKVGIAVPVVSHLVTSAARNFEVITKAVAACEVDAMCSTATWGAQMNAVARMLFSAGGGTYVCTGTLLADQKASSTNPYFLSANHCISSQTVASTLTSYWFYRSASCNSAAPGASQQLGGGATLLYASSNTDTVFLRLNNTPPAGVTYAGWYAASTPGFGTSVTGLHHPHGEWLKISNGRLNAYLSCTPPTNGSFTCDLSTGSAGTFYDIGWSSGITEPGSSGSGLFRSDGLLIGQLYGGGGTCSDPSDDIYGRFDVAYNASLKSFLTGNSLTVAKTGTGTGLVTSVPSGINCGATCTAGFDTSATVTLTATPGATSVISGWSGACSGAGACVVSMSQARSVTATFGTANGVLTVTNGGNGVVTSDPAGINCGASCASAFTLGSTVALTATPSRDMAFKGWSGACAGTGACVVTINGAVSVGATFGARSAATVSVTSTANPTALGQMLTLRATVTGNAGAAGGMVTFSSDGSPIADCAAVPVASGLAVCNTSALTLGSHGVVAYYSGDATYNASQSPSIVQVVQPLAVSLSNLSTRGQVLSGGDVMIGGFVIDGPGAKTVVVRAIGPSLAAYGIASPLANPMLTLVRASDQQVVAVNDDWGSAANLPELAATGLVPADAKESAILTTLAPGAYTAIVSGVGGATGVGVFEVYEVDRADVPMVNLSTRGRVGTGADVMIGGFVVKGNGPQTVVVRARGPSLTQYGIANALANPTLTLVRAADNVAVATNDNWPGASNAAQLQATGFAPPDALEAAIHITLNPGAYTAIVNGSGAAGVAIVEVFAVR
jgi:hypothetical protein